MTAAAATLQGADGGFALSGELTRANVAELWSQGIEEFAGAVSLELDLAQVSMCDSAGVAMLVDWLRVARSKGQALRFRSPPPQLLAIAGVADLVPLFEHAAE